MSPATLRVARGGTLVLGGGFAGAYVARLLGKRGATIVSPESSMLYTPLLPEAASGTLEPRHVVVPLRQMCPHAELVLGTRRLARRRARTVGADTIAGPAEIRYERLVVALGAVSRVLPVPGLVEHGRGFKDLADAIALRNHVLQRLEAAAAGGPPSELGLRLRRSGLRGCRGARRSSTISRRRRCATTRRCGTTPQRWVLVDAAPAILAGDPTRLGSVRGAASSSGARIEIHVGETLASYDGETRRALGRHRACRRARSSGRPG